MIKQNMLYISSLRNIFTGFPANNLCCQQILIELHNIYFDITAFFW